MMATVIIATLMCCLGAALAQYTTPVPILKQINRHNEDGSYTYGYEGADGSFKIETKNPAGEVAGKFGYVDDTGNLREIEYGAGSRGYEPFGDGITVAPPTIHQGGGVPDDGQYYPEKYEDPYIGEVSKQPRNQNPARFYSYSSGGGSHFQQPQHRFQERDFQRPQQQYHQPQQQYHQPQQQYHQEQYQEQQYHQQQPLFPQLQQRFQSQPRFQQPRPQPQYYHQPQYRHTNYRREPIVLDPNVFNGHPASGIDLNSGSYSTSLTFSG